jgi:oligoendopeptidase F
MSRREVPPEAASRETGQHAATTAEAHPGDARATGPEGVEWSLDDLYDGPDDPAILGDLAAALEGAQALAERIRGRVAELSAGELADALVERERIASLVDRARAYADLRHAADTSDDARGALVQQTLERATAVQQELLFFDLEWLAADDEHAEGVVADPTVERYAGFLRAARRYRPHVLSEPEERLDAEKRVTGQDAWTRLFDQLLAELRVRFEGRDLPLDDAFSRLLRVTVQDERRAIAEAITDALTPGLRTRAFVLNVVGGERASEDRLRGYPTWISARNLGNQLSDEAARTLIDGVTARYDVAHRYYALKARLLGLPKLYDYDRLAPVSAGEPAAVSWDEAREIVTGSFASFAPEAGQIIDRMFEQRRIDAAVRPGKGTGAFCKSVAERDPYVLMSYTGERRSVLILAHELGHALHGVLSNPRGVLSMRPPLTLAETASVFGEAITFRAMYERTEEPAARLELVIRRLDDALATVFRQIALNRFEDAVHTARREQGEVGLDRLAELWTTTQQDVSGDAVELTEGFRSWWSYVPHFVYLPGYVYAYAFGYLFSMAIYRRYVEEGDAIVEPLFDLLRAGGSAPPDELARRLGFDLDDLALWSQGLEAISELVDEAEGLAAQV